MKQLLYIAVLGFLTLNASAVTEKEWWKLYTSEKVELLYNGELDAKSFGASEITDPAFKKAINEMAQIVLRHAGTERIDSDLELMPHTFTVGEPRASYLEVFKTEDGKTVALQLTLYQDGGATKSREIIPPQKHYATEEDAKKDGLDAEKDVNWQVHSYFQWDGKSDYSLLKVDIYDEGGFSWAGW